MSVLDSMSHFTSLFSHETKFLIGGVVENAGETPINTTPLMRLIMSP